MTMIYTPSWVYSRKKEKNIICSASGFSGRGICDVEARHTGHRIYSSPVAIHRVVASNHCASLVIHSCVSDRHSDPSLPIGAHMQPFFHFLLHIILEWIHGNLSEDETDGGFHPMSGVVTYVLPHHPGTMTRAG